jgi:DNA-binding GntR family transcriptional regulator
MELKPGEHLVEAALAARLGTSSVPVREALLMLERDGFITIIPRRGAFVTKLEQRDLEEIFELRELLEGRAAAHAAEQLLDPVVDRLVSIIDSVDADLEQGDRSRCHGLFIEFDDVIFESTSNSRLGVELKNLRDQVARIGVVMVSLPGRVETSQREHAAVVAAIRARSADDAETAMRAHVRSMRRDLLTANPEYLAILRGDGNQ